MNTITFLLVLILSISVYAKTIAGYRETAAENLKIEPSDFKSKPSNSKTSEPIEVNPQAGYSRTEAGFASGLSNSAPTRQLANAPAGVEAVRALEAFAKMSNDSKASKGRVGETPNFTDNNGGAFTRAMAEESREKAANGTK